MEVEGVGQLAAHAVGAGWSRLVEHEVGDEEPQHHEHDPDPDRHQRVAQHEPEQQREHQADECTEGLERDDAVGVPPRRVAREVELAPDDAGLVASAEAPADGGQALHRRREHAVAERLVGDRPQVRGRGLDRLDGGKRASDGAPVGRQRAAGEHREHDAGEDGEHPEGEHGAGHLRPRPGRRGGARRCRRCRAARRR